MAEKRKALGLGLGALISNDQREPAQGADILIPDRSRHSTSSEAVKKLLAPPPRRTKKTPAKRSASKETTAPKESAQKPAPKTATLKRKTRESETPETALVPVPGVTFGQIPLDSIIPNTKQPRTVFDEDELTELSESIATVGVLQPVVLRPAGNGKYELVMGERRWRASRLAGLKTVPALIRRTEDDDLLRDALLENLHRAQLNPLEEAAAYQQMMEDFGCSQAELARRIARSRPQIANTLRLLRLPAAVQNRVAAGVLSAGHARALLGLESTSDMEYLANRIVSEGISVRTTEELVALGDIRGSVPSSTGSKKTRRRPVPSPEIQNLAERLTDQLDTRVTIQVGKRRGKIVVEFVDEADLNRIIDAINQR